MFHTTRVRVDTYMAQQTPGDITSEPVSSSDVKSGSLGNTAFHKPRPLTVEEIKDVVQRFAFAAKTLYDVLVSISFVASGLIRAH
jgi:2,4-dienoyl-CoA reductase-like NADH-dependent reductase (Old Yellow Enzyme family)